MIYDFICSLFRYKLWLPAKMSDIYYEYWDHFSRIWFLWFTQDFGLILVQWVMTQILYSQNKHNLWPKRRRKQSIDWTFGWFGSKRDQKRHGLEECVNYWAIHSIHCWSQKSIQSDVNSLFWKLLKSVWQRDNKSKTNCVLNLWHIWTLSLTLC